MVKHVRYHWSVEKDIGNGRRHLAKKLSKSTSDLATQAVAAHEDEMYGDDSASTASNTPTHRDRGLRRRGFQLSGVWASLKKFAPQRLTRARSKEQKKALADKRRLADTRRALSTSHPDVSRANSTDYAGDSSEPEASRSATPSLSPSPKRTARAGHHMAAKCHGDGGDGPFTNPKAKSDLCSALTKADSLEMSILRNRHMALRQHAFFEVSIHLREGRQLVARDSCGTSDPYVKFKVGGRLVYKSKTINKSLNPEWDERFTLPIEDVFEPIHVKVFDYDWGLQDDFMGSAYLDLTSVEPHRPSDVMLTLSDPGKNDNMGQLHLLIHLIPRTQEEKEQYFHRNVRLADASRKLKSQIWSSVVTIVLVEAKDLITLAENCNANPYAKFRLANEKYKSKTVLKTVNPQWLEQFDLHMFDDQSNVLEIVICDARSKDEVMGKCNIDLSALEKEKTHRICQDLDDNNGSIFLLLTVSGTTSAETISDLTSFEPNPREKELLLSKYSIWRTFNNLKDVGHLTIKVFKAQGLASADIGGKSDPFCVLELVNARLQTQTEYKTLSPEWQKIFTFNVKDIHSVLEVTVYDEDRDHKVEFLGKVAIPLLKVRNPLKQNSDFHSFIYFYSFILHPSSFILQIRNGERRWYVLKDKKLRSRVKGQILLEMQVHYNALRASIRTFNPKEEKYMQPDQKFKRQVFIQNVMRIKYFIMLSVDVAKYVQSCFEWESRLRSIAALIIFVLTVYNFELYMTPICLLLLFVRNFIILSIAGTRAYGDSEDDDASDDDDMDDEDKDGKEEKKSLKERLHAIQEVTQSVQNVLGYIASIAESVKNTFNFTEPFLSWLAIFSLMLAAYFLYHVPLRWLILAWGINKFTRKLRAPHSIPNNELLDFLSRVPDDELLLDIREFRPAGNSAELERNRAKKKKVS
uniref:C2 domain-containing protein n=1 Tax=Strigamia maritima TaxID=126957 RepID=T1JFU4_STRMM